MSFPCVRIYRYKYILNFYSWKFDQNGKCIEIPYNKENAKIPENAKTRVWKSLEQNQMIIVWYHAENEEPTWEPHHIKEVDEGRYIRHGFSEEYIRCHAQVKKKTKKNLD